MRARWCLKEQNSRTKCGGRKLAVRVSRAPSLRHDRGGMLTTHAAKAPKSLTACDSGRSEAWC